MKLVSDDMRDPAYGLGCHHSRSDVHVLPVVRFRPTSGYQGEFKPVSDKVVLSPLAQDMAMAMRWMDRLPDVRTEIVSGLKQKIADGEYQPDAQMIAENMIGESLVNQFSIC